MRVFADPEGAVFCVWQPGSHRGSGAVNEHGAVNFNNLHTDDVEAAPAFYGQPDTDDARMRTTSKISPSVRSPRCRPEWIASIAAWISASRCGPGIS
jgi:hypothetical protein